MSRRPGHRGGGRRPWGWRILAAAVTSVAGAAIVAGLTVAAAARGIGAPAGEAAPVPPVTPVEGPSWLAHLGLTVSETSMGQMGGETGPEATGRREPGLEDLVGQEGALHSMLTRFLSLFRFDRGEAEGALQQPFLLAGADLYRLNCRSCHGPDGRGSPPEIRSVLGPVQGASAAMIEARMKKLGRTLPEAMAEQLAAQGEATIRTRLRKGGQKMPALPYLRDDEVEALLGYLGTLADVPPTRRTEKLVRESAARVGEQLVKGTCHVCHAATGPGRGRGMMMMMRGVIPSLASMPEQESLGSVIHQVQGGSPPMMGMMAGNQLMPAYPYITQDEAAAAYLYLGAYPPQR